MFQQNSLNFDKFIKNVYIDLTISRESLNLPYPPIENCNNVTVIVTHYLGQIGTLNDC